VKRDTCEGPHTLTVCFMLPKHFSCYATVRVGHYASSFLYITYVCSPASYEVEESGRLTVDTPRLALRCLPTSKADASCKIAFSHSIGALLCRLAISLSSPLSYDRCTPPLDNCCVLFGNRPLFLPLGYNSWLEGCRLMMIEGFASILTGRLQSRASSWEDRSSNTRPQRDHQWP
jgi:hypothetical protein